MLYPLVAVGLMAFPARVLGAECILAGPGFPSPSRLSNSSHHANATSVFEALLLETDLLPNDTAWAVALFSSKENKTLYERYHTPQIDIGVRQVDQDSVFRIASISKVFTVWTFLKEVGDEHFNDPITWYIPELASLTGNTETVYDDLDQVRWDDVTLGQLASSTAGIPRDVTQSDLSALLAAEQASALGFPTLSSSEVPSCGIPGVTAPCSRNETIAYLMKQHPVFSTEHSPAYSNMGFTLLALAQEAITGVTAGTSIADNIFGPLGMNQSSYEVAPPIDRGVIPGGVAKAGEVGWDVDMGLTAPSGSLYVSTSDMIKAGQAILQSTTMPRAKTRRWLQPRMATGYLGSLVGAPWEIRQLAMPSAAGRMTQLYTKQGDLGGYHAALVLAPEHDLGWVVMTAGPLTSTAPQVRQGLMNAFGSVFLPAAERQARDEAAANFAGTFVDVTTNSSAEVIVDESSGHPGLLVTHLMSRGVQVIGQDSPLIQLYGAGQFGRLYPSGLQTVSRCEVECEGTYVSRLGFRATFFNATEDGQVEDPCLMSWTALGAPLYGQVSLDDWGFEMGEAGRAEVLNVRMLRLRLNRPL